MTSFTSRLADAIRRRTYPNTSLHIPQLAGAIGSDGRSLTRWCRGENKPYAEAIDGLAQFFRSRGDNAFLAEVYGVEQPAPDFASLRHELHAVLSRLPAETVPVVSTRVWFDDTGLCLPAPAGHADLVRRHIGLSLHVKGDLRASQCRNRGWIALESDGAGKVVIYHHATAASPQAVQTCQEWLCAHSDSITFVTRQIEIDGTVGAVSHPDAQSAIDALGRLVAPTHRTPLQIDRRSLDEMPRDFWQIIAAFHGAPDIVIPTACDLGLMRRATILAVDGSAVVNQFMGPGIGFARSEIVGRNVLARADAAYGAMIHSRVMRTHQEQEPIFHRISGSAYGQSLNYVSLATPAGNNQVLTVSRELESA